MEGGLIKTVELFPTARRDRITLRPSAPTGGRAAGRVRRSVCEPERPGQSRCGAFFGARPLQPAAPLTGWARRAAALYGLDAQAAPPWER